MGYRCKFARATSRFGFRGERPFFYLALENLVQIASLCELGHDAEIGRGEVVEGVPVADYEGRIDAREKTHLVESVVDLLLLELLELDHLEGVELIVVFSPHFPDGGVRAFADFLHDFKILQLAARFALLLRHGRIVHGFFRFGVSNLNYFKKNNSQACGS